MKWALEHIWATTIKEIFVVKRITNQCDLKSLVQLGSTIDIFWINDWEAKVYDEQEKCFLLKMWWMFLG